MMHENGIWNHSNVRYEHLEHKSFVELFALQRETEHRLEKLRKHEPSARRKDAAYTAWIGSNVECIETLQNIRKEIRRRKERACHAGITVFSYDGKVLLM